MASKNISELQVGDSVKLPGYSNYVKISEIRESEDRYVIDFPFNNITTSCAILKEMVPSLEPFDVKPVARN